MDAPQLTLNDGGKMPMLGLGTSRLSNAYKAVRSALDMGYRQIDTAAMYGNEAEVGRAIKDSHIPREDIFITTKLDNHDHGRVAAAVQASLDQLDCGYIDLYLIHWPVPARLASWQTLVKLRQSGAPLKSLGVSNFTIRHLAELLAQTTVKPAVNQVEFNPFMNQPDLLAYTQGQGILLEAYSPISRAHRLDDEWLAKVAAAHQKTPAQVLLRWSVQQGVAVIPRSQSAVHQRANMDLFDWQLTPAEMNGLAGLNEGFRVTSDPEEWP